MIKYKKYSLLCIIFATLLIISACQSSDKVKVNDSQSPKDKNTVFIQNYSYDPLEITIQKGETVKWINKDSVGHTVTGDKFDSEILRKDRSYEHEFKEAGTFYYFCKPHPYMKARVIVK